MFDQTPEPLKLHVKRKLIRRFEMSGVKIFTNVSSFCRTRPAIGARAMVVLVIIPAGGVLPKDFKAPVSLDMKELKIFQASGDKKCINEVNTYFSIEAEGKDPYELDFSGTFQKMQSHPNKTTEDAAAPPREVVEGSPLTESGIQTLLNSQFGPAFKKCYPDHEELHQEMIKTTCIGM
jgi:hypothetical protein